MREKDRGEMKTESKRTMHSMWLVWRLYDIDLEQIEKNWCLARILLHFNTWPE